MYDFAEDSTSNIPIAFRKVSIYDISNFVDGLTCAYRFKDDGFYLLNPFIRELAKLPRSSSSDGHSNFRFGFGRDDTTGEYKLVRLFSSDNLNHYSCEILTLGAQQQQWRYLGKTPCPVLSTDPVYLQGTLCWKGSNNSLLAFDIRREDIYVLYLEHVVQILSCQYG